MKTIKWPVLHKLGQCDVFSYKSLTKILYNKHYQFYVFLKDSILIKISGIHSFLQNKVFFRFSYRGQPGTKYLSLPDILSHPC